MVRKGYNNSLLIFSLPALVILWVIKLYPAILGFWFAVTNSNGVSKSYNFVGLSNFKEIFTADPNFWNSMVFTLKYCVINVVLLNVLALALALAIEGLGSKLKSTFRTIFYMPNMISMIIGGFMWNFIFTQVLYYIADNTPLRFLDQSWIGDPKYSFWAIMIVSLWGGVGYIMIIYIAAITGVPASIMEAARIDGASSFSILFRIILPMIRHAFTICFFITLNSAFQVFDVIFALTGGGPGRATQAVSLNIYEEAFRGNLRYGYATAKSTILFVIVLIITCVQLFVMKRKEEVSE